MKKKEQKEFVFNMKELVGYKKAISFVHPQLQENIPLFDLVQNMEVTPKTDQAALSINLKYQTGSTENISLNEDELKGINVLLNSEHLYDQWAKKKKSEKKIVHKFKKNGEEYEHKHEEEYETLP